MNLAGCGLLARAFRHHLETPSRTLPRQHHDVQALNQRRVFLVLGMERLEGRAAERVAAAEEDAKRFRGARGGSCGEVARAARYAAWGSLRYARDAEHCADLGINQIGRPKLCVVAGC